MAAKTSKNQRSGVRQKQKVYQCPQGHDLVAVKVVGRGMRWTCACSGYTPIRMSDPYLSIKPKGIPGKKTDAIRGGDAVLCKS